MNSAARDTFVIVRRELADLGSDVALIVVAVGSAVGLPLYLGYLAAGERLAADHIPAWALEAALVQVFIASTTTLQGLALEREQGTLVPLMLAPVCDLALFLGKALPGILLSLGQAAAAVALFCAMLAARNSALLSRFDLSTVLTIAAVTVSAATMCVGAGISLASRMRSARAIALALTLSSLAAVSLESTLALWTILEPAGRALWLDVAVTQVALGLAVLAVSAALYRRERLIKRLWR